MAAVATGSRKRVLFLIPTLTGGGAERVIVTLLKHLDRSRFELALAVVDTRDAVFRPDVPADVEFIDLGQRRVRHQDGPTGEHPFRRSTPDLARARVIAHRPRARRRRQSRRQCGRGVHDLRARSSDDGFV